MTATTVRVPSSAAARPLALPDEQFWLRYSPHGELPLSTASSIALHVLGFGLLLLVGCWLIAEPAPFEPKVGAVLLDEPIASGGGARPDGAPQVTEPSGPHAVPVDTGHKTDTAAGEPAKKFDQLTAPGPSAVEGPDDARRRITESTSPTNLKATEALFNLASKKVGPVKSPKGDGGNNGTGGKGDGPGNGVGDGPGPGNSTAALTQRQKRNNRWTMHFATTSAHDYLAQLEGIGAVLAVPTATGTIEEEVQSLKLIKDLHKRPAELVPLDNESINKIHWWDEDPRSVRDMMQLLGLSLRPNRFCAFIPLKIEDELYNLETAARKGRPEEDVMRTHFDLRKSGSEYRPVLREIIFR
jgi:hypothetical protein